MTVDEMMDKLAEMPPDLPVYIQYGGMPGWAEVQVVELDKADGGEQVVAVGVG